MARPVNHLEAIDAIRERQPFVSGGRRGSGRYSFWAQGDADWYAVYSYNEPIAWCERGIWRLNPTKYSVTTSRHQAYVRRAVGFQTVAEGWSYPH